MRVDLLMGVAAFVTWALPVPAKAAADLPAARRRRKIVARFRRDWHGRTAVTHPRSTLKRPVNNRVEKRVAANILLVLDFD